MIEQRPGERRPWYPRSTQRPRQTCRVSRWTGPGQPISDKGSGGSLGGRLGQTSGDYLLKSPVTPMTSPRPRRV